MVPAYSTYSVTNTDVRLYRDVPIADGMHPIWQNAEAQFEDWQKHRNVIVNNSLYVDGSKGTLNLSIDPARALACDYLTFVNHKFEGKIFYARITDTRQISNVAVTIDFVIDNFQTYMFDFKMRGGVVLREHLTEEQHQRAIENPWREDIPELFTDEGFSLTSAEEVKYKRPDRLNVSQNAISPYHGNDPRLAFTDFTPEEPDGVPGLVEVLGEPTIIPNTRAATYANHTTNYAIVAEITDNLLHAYYRWYDRDRLEGSIGANEGKFARALQSGYGYASGSGTTLFALHISTDTPGSESQGYLRNISAHFIGRALTEQHAPDLLNVFILPKSVMNHSIGAYNRMNVATPGTASDSLRNTKSPRYEVNFPRYSYLYGDINPKLERFPFRYIRVNSPAGEDKELVIEKFKNATPVVAMFSELTGSPAIHVAPMSYNGHSIDLPNRLTYEGFPQLPSAGDSYRSYIRARAAALLDSDTQNARRARDIAEGRKRGQKQFNWANPSSYVEGLAPIAQKIGETVGGFFGIAKGIKTGDPQSAIEEASQARFERMQLRQAEEIISGNMSTETFTGEQAPGGTFAIPRGLTAGHGEFIAGDTTGELLMFLDRMHFEVITVTYQREVINSYSNFLEAYGYRSDSVAQPRVMDYIRGGVGPRFVDMDGLTFTYCQTEQIKIYGVTPSAAADIAAVFNGGARFTKGF